MMRTIRPILAAVFALSVAGVSLAEAGERGPHPVRGWNGNKFLFEVQPQGEIVHLVAYRAVGHRWQSVGATTVGRDQRTPGRGWLQQVWFHGRDLGRVEADLSNPFWRRYPAEDGGAILEH